MQENRTVMIRVSYLVELPNKEIAAENGILENIIDNLCETRDLFINNNNITIEWNSTSSLILEPMEMNCGKCSNCGQWTTDREKPNSIDGLCNGATIGGELLCDSCLPSDHIWAF